MQQYTDRRGRTDDDYLWFVEHPAVFTQGQAGRAEHLLAPGSIPVVQVDRGGQVTYHGPGQLVAYPMIDLRRRGLGIRATVDALEETVIRVLAEYDIQVMRRDGAPGVYTEQAKVASIGLRVRRGCTFHGLAFNVAMDLEPFARINPCGFAGLAVTDVQTLGGPAELAAIRDHFARHFGQIIGAPLQWPESDPIVHSLLAASAPQKEAS